MSGTAMPCKIRAVRLVPSEPKSEVPDGTAIRGKSGQVQYSSGIRARPSPSSPHEGPERLARPRRQGTYVPDAYPRP